MDADLEYIPGGKPDAGLTYYTLEHGFQWLSGNQESFWSAPFFYPEPMVVTFAEHLIGAIPIYSVIRLLGLDRETSYQWWIIIIFILNYVSCVWVLRKFSISWLSAAAGAYIFTFSLPVIARISQMNLLIRFMVPLAFYFTWSYLNKPKIIFLIGLCLSIALQFYCSMHIGVFLFLVIAAFIISSAVLNRKQYNWYEILWGSRSKFACRISIVTVSVLVLLPLLIPYYYSSLEVGVHSWSKISNMLPRIQSLIAPTYGSLFWNWLEPLNETLPGLQHSFFIGLIPWLSVAAVLLWRRNKNRNSLSDIGRTAALSILLIILITLYWNGFSFYKYISLIPGFKAIYEVTRIILVLSFLFAVSVGVLFTRLEKHENKKSSAILLAFISFILLGLLVTDQYVLPDLQPRYPKSEHQSEWKNVANRVLKKNPSAKVFAYMPLSYTGMPQHFHMHAMLASQSIHIPTINGYSSRWPQGYSYFFLNYNKPWALKRWMVFTQEKYSTHRNSTENLFDGLVIVGGSEDNVDSLLDNVNNLPISIAHEPLPDEGFKAEILPSSEKITAKNNTTIVLYVKVTNMSGVTWPALGEEIKDNYRNKISLSYHWLSLNGEKIEGPRYELPYDLAPRQSITLRVEIKAPSIPGRYIVEFDMVQELVSWFVYKGSKTARIEVISD
jgi:hypothetical protein